MSINAGYNKIKETSKQKENINNETTAQPSITQKESSQPKISEETKQICADSHEVFVGILLFGS